MGSYIIFKFLQLQYPLIWDIKIVVIELAWSDQLVNERPNINEFVSKSNGKVLYN
jgi:hypothetical protein